MREILQGQIKADSKGAGAASLCLCLGGQMWNFLCILLDLYPCKQDTFTSCKIQCHTAIPSTVFAPLSS